MKRRVFSEENKQVIGYLLIIIGSVFLIWWCIFSFSFILAIGSNGDQGDIVRGGVYLLKEKTIFSLVTIVWASFVGYKLSKIYS